MKWNDSEMWSSNIDVLFDCCKEMNDWKRGERERERVREGKRMKGKEEEKEDGKERTVKVELKTSSWSSKVTENIIRH